MPRLTLIDGTGRHTGEFEPPPYRLGELAQRPGELADLVVVKFSPTARARADEIAARATLPLSPALVITVEAERAVAEAAAALGLCGDKLAADLDTVAATLPDRVFNPPPTRRLRAYARALRSGGYPTMKSRRIELPVPHRLAARWTIAAQEAGLTLEAWIEHVVCFAGLGHEKWEAHAAADGRTLAEWVLLQAAQALRRSRRSSSAAQPSASA